MQNEAANNPGTLVGVLGCIDFQNRVTALLNTPARNNIRATASSWSGGWSMILSSHPQILVIEIGLQHSERQQGWLRKFLAQIRERFAERIYVIVALSASERFGFGGDLLFTGEGDSSPSGFVDSFIVQPPGNTPGVPSLMEQLVDAVGYARSEMERRTQSLPALPTLNQPGWVQSLADPQSRALWMKWLPRYASYVNENPIIVGRTGTGKTQLAYALHLLSGRKGRFVSITPRDFSSSELVQAELFGAVPGAYTGAVEKWGLVKSAEGGTLFIDELQSIDKELQGKLITFIENKAYRRVGSADSISADVRFVFATNKSLSEMMESNILRHDFAYRLERVVLNLPALEARRLDIGAALAYALAKIHRQRPHTESIFGITSGAYRKLFGLRWPGNLRQLENTLAKLTEITEMSTRALIDEASVSETLEAQSGGMHVSLGDVVSEAALQLARETSTGSIGSLADGVETLLKNARTLALDANGGDSNAAANLLHEDSHILNLFAQAEETRREAKVFSRDEIKGK